MILYPQQVSSEPYALIRCVTKEEAWAIDIALFGAACFSSLLLCFIFIYRSFNLSSSKVRLCLSSCISESFSFNSFANAAISFLLCIDAITFSLSLTVDKVELPMAACSGFQASFNRRSNALLWPKSTRAACSSVLSSDTVSSYNWRNDGVILPIS